MKKQKMFFATSATAVSAIALLTCPALAQALPMIPLNQECGQYAFSGLTVLNQSNGYRLGFNAVGPTVNAPVTSFNNRQAVAGRGTLNGGINGREVTFTVFWDNGVTGEYSGSANNNGRTRGTTYSPNAGGEATWNFKSNLQCAE